MDPRSKRNVLVGAAAVVVVSLAVLLTIGQRNVFIWLAGVPAGVAVGLVAHEYAPVVRDGLYAGSLGTLVVALLVTAEGFYRSVSWGFGLDSWVSFGGAAKGLWSLVAIGPAIVCECLLVAAVVHEIRVRRGAWVDEGNGNSRVN